MVILFSLNIKILLLKPLIPMEALMTLMLMDYLENYGHLSPKDTLIQMIMALERSFFPVRASQYP